MVNDVGLSHRIVHKGFIKKDPSNPSSDPSWSMSIIKLQNWYRARWVKGYIYTRLDGYRAIDRI
jgi:hypothetical protein